MLGGGGRSRTGWTEVPSWRGYIFRAAQALARGPAPSPRRPPLGGGAGAGPAAGRAEVAERLREAPPSSEAGGLRPVAEQRLDAPRHPPPRVTLEAAGPVLAKRLRELGRRWEARPEALGCCVASSLSPGFVGLWLVPLGNIQVLACNQYLPRGPAELQPKERLGSQEGGCLAAVLVCKGWRPSLGSPPLPQGSAAPLAFWGPPPGAGFPPTLGFWRSQSLCVRWRFPLSSLILKAFTTSSPFSVSVTMPALFPSSLANTAAARDRSLRGTLPTLLPSSLR